ncbi:sensor histidine kinase [Mucilaginibacter mali]|uniref:histidine kinase n=1 Tax=Mucilaginibacter mali TaxID=2740462 RepID=A0A7D4UC92_9SPHI|nr:7TM diverse intracellular signaling domain-containing protein [Mucilaginibacter mali]QKJ29079.1 sensor histidine kinase [Mucilaginibacter mali]
MLWCFAAKATDTLTISNNQSVLLSKRYFTQLEDREANLTIADIAVSKDFHHTKTQFPFINYADSVIWVKLTLHNKTIEPYLPVTINFGVIDGFDLYDVGITDRHVIHLGSTDVQDKKNNSKQISRIINCPVLPDSVCTIYLRIKSNDSMAIPIRIQSADYYLHSSIIENVTVGFFMGIIGIMVLYNLMLYILVKDRSYLYYIFYIIFLGLTQWQLRGLGTNFLPVDKQLLNNYLIPLTRVGFWYSILMFVREFLQLKEHQSKIYSRYYYVLYILVSLPVVATLFKQATLALSLITIIATINSIVLLLIGISLYVKGFKPAKFFMLAWSLFLITVLATIARNKGLLPYNDLTANLILYSSAFELIMFSVALADRINFYRKQSLETKELALAIARENERLITGQNFALENKVKERTQELIETNKNLSVTIENLKSAQIQLIDTEKMASLGQLTAGIAHEINNPINFVSANIKPLKMDFLEVFNLIEYYRQLVTNPTDAGLQEKAASYAKEIDIDFIKEEIITLLEGIEEGAGRTTEIVHSLRTFSRTDELVLKAIDINKSILTTLVLLRSTIPYGIEIKPLLDKLPLLNCYPGKINQVLVNLINNSIQAIKAKPVHNNEHILIITRDYPENISIEITDTGIGMSDEVKLHMFEPFYTTKDIGEGTGLGLSIVFGIIEKHHGTIEVKSAPGEGTTFTVILPKTLQ